MPINAPEVPLEKSWKRVLRIWWAMLWRMVLWVFVIMAVVTTLADSYMLEYPVVAQALSAATVFLFLPFGIVALRMVINKEFKGFRLVLLPVDAKDDAVQQEETEKTHTKTNE